MLVNNAGDSLFVGLALKLAERGPIASADDQARSRRVPVLTSNAVSDIVIPDIEVTS